MTTDNIIVGLIVAVFAGFEIVLFWAWIYVSLGDRKPVKSNAPVASGWRGTGAHSASDADLAA